MKRLCDLKETRHKRPCIVWFHLHEIFRIGKSIDTESRLVVACGGRGRKENSAVKVKGMFQGDENILKLTLGMVAPPNIPKSIELYP